MTKLRLLPILMALAATPALAQTPAAPAPRPAVPAVPTPPALVAPAPVVPAPVAPAPMVVAPAPAAAPAPASPRLITADQRISASHVVALGVGMFTGAMLGSALINGGALAAAIGGLAGLAVGHWMWVESDAE